MRVAMARSTGPVVEAKLRWLGSKFLRWTPMTLAAEDRSMSARKREERLPMSHKREGGRCKAVHRMTALAAIPVATALKLPLMYILVTGGALRIVPMNNVEVAAFMFGMAVFTASPGFVLSDQGRMQPPSVLLQALSNFGVTIEAFEPWQFLAALWHFEQEVGPVKKLCALDRGPCGVKACAVADPSNKTKTILNLTTVLIFRASVCLFEVGR